jgi:hypothetical protein
LQQFLPRSAARFFRLISSRRRLVASFSCALGAARFVDCVHCSDSSSALTLLCAIHFVVPLISEFASFPQIRQQVAFLCISVLLRVDSVCTQQFSPTHFVCLVSCSCVCLHADLISLLLRFCRVHRLVLSGSHCSKNLSELVFPRGSVRWPVCVLDFVPPFPAPVCKDGQEQKLRLLLMSSFTSSKALIFV